MELGTVFARRGTRVSTSAFSQGKFPRGHTGGVASAREMPPHAPLPTLRKESRSPAWHAVVSQRGGDEGERAGELDQGQKQNNRISDRCETNGAPGSLQPSAVFGVSPRSSPQLDSRPAQMPMSDWAVACSEAAMIIPTTSAGAPLQNSPQQSPQSSPIDGVKGYINSNYTMVLGSDPSRYA